MLDHLGSYQASRRRRVPVPALPPYIIEPIWEQLVALLPQREINHPLGCQRPRIPDRVIFEKLVQVLVFGCAYERIADEECSATTLRDLCEEWIELGVMDALRKLALEAYDLALAGWNFRRWRWNGCITKAPCGGEKAGRSPVDREESGAPNARRRWTLRASPWAPSLPRPTATTRRSCPRLWTP
jgi:hypothetical protein